MSEFEEIPASASGVARRRPLFGIGMNDANYMVSQVIDGKRCVCPFYSTWRNMLERCYSDKFQERKSTYIGCSVAKEWLTFSVFRNWMNTQNWKGNELDKDILIAGNKIYSTQSCIFISSQVNTLLNNCAANRGEYPQGVDFHKREGKYRARLRCHGKRKELGYFTTPELAGAAYKIAKRKHIIEVAQTQEPRVKAGLLRHAELLK